MFALHPYPDYAAHYLRQLVLFKIKLCSTTLESKVVKMEFSFEQICSLSYRLDSTLYVPGIIENRTVVPSTGGKCVEYDSISFRYMYELTGALASMCNDTACLPQY